ncbi:MAG: sulfatase-like hydrolase/transferase [Candidatus Thiodiazotropha sp.]
MRKLVISLALEMLVWYGIACVFLFIYIFYYSGQFGVILHHLRLLSSIVIGFVVLRLIFWKWCGGLRWLSSFIGGFILLTLILYYMVTIAGLQAWGRVISWDLIYTYSSQITPLLISQQLSPLLFFLILSLIYLSITVIIAIKPAKNDWVGYISKKLTGAGALFISIASICFALVLMSPLFFMPFDSVDAGEPFSLTFYPNAQRAQVLQAHRVAASAVLSQREKQAIEEYRVNVNAVTRNVVVFVADALRLDHMQIYGYPRNTTPYLSSLKKEGKLDSVKTLRSTCAESSCGLLSMSRSKYVHQFIDKSFGLLDVLKLHGYSIRMILGGDHTNFYGLRDAYGAVDSFYDGSFSDDLYMNDDNLIINQVTAMSNWDQKPTYLQFHLMSTHPLGTRHPSSKKFLPSRPYSLFVTQSLMGRRVSDEFINYYDNGVYQLDSVIGKLIDLLSDKGYLKNAVVILTSDHGEMLGEHGQFGHANGVHENVLGLPFILMRFGYHTENTLKNINVSSQVDVAPTILTELDMPLPTTWSGSPLQFPIKRDYVYYQQPPFVGLYDASDSGNIYKYWRNTKSQEEYCYNVSTDPQEKNNIIDSVSDEIRAIWNLKLLQTAPAKPAIQ